MVILGDPAESGGPLLAVTVFNPDGQNDTYPWPFAWEQSSTRASAGPLLRRATAASKSAAKTGATAKSPARVTGKVPAVTTESKPTK